MTIADTFGRSRLSLFLNSSAGRLVRSVAGIGLIAWGYTLRGSPAGIVLLVLGLLLFVAGAFDLCLISALLGGPISGARIRKSIP